MFTPPQSPIPRGWLIGLFVLAAGAPAAFPQLVDWEAALAASAGQSSFVSVEATPDSGSGDPSVLTAGNFIGNLSFGPLPNLTNANGQDGVVARLDTDAGPPWQVTWKLQATSTSGSVSINDLAVADNGLFYVCGTYTADLSFGAITLPNAVGVTRGFVAWGDPDSSSPGWVGAFDLAGLEPESIAVAGDLNIEIYLAGPGAFPGDLARLYDDTGSQLWSSPTALPNSDTNPTDIALGFDASGPLVYVLAEDPSGSASEAVVLFQLDPSDGSTLWERRMGSPGTDTAGGLAVPGDGEPRLAFASNDNDISFEANSIPGIPSLSGTHALMLKVDSNGDLAWATQLGILNNANGTMVPSDVAVDDVGNAYASTKFTGTFRIEGINESGSNDAAIMGVDGTGLLFEFQRSTGTSNENARAVSAPIRALLVTVGDYSGNSSEFDPFTLPAVPGSGPGQGFVAIAGRAPGQQRYILRPLSPINTAQLEDAINDPSINGQVYHELFLDGTSFGLSASLTTEQLALLDNALPAGSFNFEPDLPLVPNGTTSTSGWALGHLNDAATASAPYSFSYPDTSETVYVYLIDTAVGSDDVLLQADLETWFSGNTNLSLEPTSLIRGSGDPVVSSEFEHGTHMLSLIAGPDTGAAVGVPLVVKNFDFYPNGPVTTSSLLADAIDAAMTWHDSNAGCAPGIIVIASGSVPSDSSSTLTTYIQRARDKFDLAVVLSAGNESGNTADYTPSENGGEAGIICVAASTEGEAVESCSNVGSEVEA